MAQIKPLTGDKQDVDDLQKKLKKMKKIINATESDKQRFLLAIVIFLREYPEENFT